MRIVIPVKVVPAGVKWVIVWAVPVIPGVRIIKRIGIIPGVQIIPVIPVVIIRIRRYITAVIPIGVIIYA